MARETVRFVSIDDHPSISDALRQASASYDDLEMIGSFTSVNSVPNPLREPGDLVDVFVLDLNLPGSTGLDGLEVVLGWGVTVLVFTANSQSRLARDVIDRGAAGFVSKSVPTLQVLDAVRAVCRGEQVVAGVDQPAVPVSALSPADERLLAALTVDTRSKSLAEALFLSPRTVDNMITELYWKVGLEGTERSRAALRDWGRRNGFGGPISP